MAVTLAPMSPERYAEWRAASVQTYGEDIATATGLPEPAALERAATQFDQLLPAGLQSPDTWLLAVVDATGTDVGSLWIGPHPDRPGIAYIFDIEILEGHRGRGLGRATMLAAERLVRDAGTSAIGLNVFGFNEPARRLYESLGYRVVATQMTKTL